MAAAFMKEAGVPGLAVGILRPGHPNIEKGYGVTRLGTDTAATEHTIYHMASISKPFEPSRMDFRRRDSRSL